MAKDDPVLVRLREICLSLPETKETPTWGKPHFRVGDKIFAGYGEEDGGTTIGFKLEMAHAAEVVKDPRYRPAKYVGHKGWVSLDAAGPIDWEALRLHILESYRLIAPKRTLARYLAGLSGGEVKQAPGRAARAPARAAKKKTPRR